MTAHQWQGTPVNINKYEVTIYTLQTSTVPDTKATSLLCNSKKPIIQNKGGTNRGETSTDKLGRLERNFQTATNKAKRGQQASGDAPKTTNIAIGYVAENGLNYAVYLRYLYCLACCSPGTAAGKAIKVPQG